MKKAVDEAWTESKGMPAKYAAMSISLFILLAYIDTEAKFIMPPYMR